VSHLNCAQQLTPIVQVLLRTARVQQTAASLRKYAMNLTTHILTTLSAKDGAIRLKSFHQQSLRGVDAVIASGVSWNDCVVGLVDNLDDGSDAVRCAVLRALATILALPNAVTDDVSAYVNKHTGPSDVKSSASSIPTYEPAPETQLAHSQGETPSLDTRSVGKGSYSALLSRVCTELENVHASHADSESVDGHSVSASTVTGDLPTDSLADCVESVLRGLAVLDPSACETIIRSKLSDGRTSSAQTNIIQDDQHIDMASAVASVGRLRLNDTAMAIVSNVITHCEILNQVNTRTC
jgi:hypothetical protein